MVVRKPLLVLLVGICFLFNGCGCSPSSGKIEATCPKCDHVIIYNGPCKNCGSRDSFKMKYEGSSVYCAQCEEMLFGQILCKKCGTWVRSNFFKVK